MGDKTINKQKEGTRRKSSYLVEKKVRVDLDRAQSRASETVGKVDVLDLGSSHKGVGFIMIN